MPGDDHVAPVDDDRNLEAELLDAFCHRTDCRIVPAWVLGVGDQLPDLLLDDLHAGFSFFVICERQDGAMRKEAT